MKRCIIALAILVPAADTLAGEDGPRVQRGQASYYHPENFTGRPMANGDRFDPQSNAAASRTLPLGTVADVTNTLTAEELGMRDGGVAPVEIRPVGRLPDRGRDGQSGTE